MSDDTDRIDGLDRLARRRAPERDLWPGIQARLAPRRSRYGLVQFALAASLVAGLAAVVTLSVQGPVGAPAGGAEVALAPRTVEDASSRAIVQANLSIVEQAERQLQQALRQNPESASLRSLLQSAENRQRALRAML